MTTNNYEPAVEHEPTVGDRWADWCESVCGRGHVRLSYGMSRRQAVQNAVAQRDWPELYDLMALWRASRTEIATAVAITGVGFDEVLLGVGGHITVLLHGYDVIDPEWRYRMRQISRAHKRLHQVRDRVGRDAV